MPNYHRLNEMFKETCLEESLAFSSALENIEKTQRNILLDNIRRNENTEFCRRFNFERIKNIQDYRNKIPILNYEDYQEFIVKIMDGEQKVLTSEPVLLLEPTSGSTSPSKFIYI